MLQLPANATPMISGLQISRGNSGIDVRSPAMLPATSPAAARHTM